MADWTVGSYVANTFTEYHTDASEIIHPFFFSGNIVVRTSSIVRFYGPNITKIPVSTFHSCPNLEEINIPRHFIATSGGIVSGGTGTDYPIYIKDSHKFGIRMDYGAIIYKDSTQLAELNKSNPTYTDEESYITFTYIPTSTFPYGEVEVNVGDPPVTYNYNKFTRIMNGVEEVILDLDNDTVTAETLLEGYTCHNNEASVITGTYAVETSKTVSGTMAQQTITPSTGKNAIESVTIQGVTRTETQGTNGICVTFG